jgi:hypothetical protein
MSPAALPATIPARARTPHRDVRAHFLMMCGLFSAGLANSAYFLYFVFSWI